MARSHDNVPPHLAEEMHGSFDRFAVDGDPGWPPYDGTTRSTMVLDRDSRMISDPAGVERSAWDGPG